MMVARTIFYLNPEEEGAYVYLKQSTECCSKYCVMSTLMSSTSGPGVPIPGVVVRENTFESFAAWEKCLYEELPNDPEWKSIVNDASGKKFFTKTEFQTFKVIDYKP